MTSISACDTDSLWFEHLSRTKTPSLRVFCMPYAGGSADIYRRWQRWQRWFPQQVDICLVHLPGRGQRVREEYSLTNKSWSAVPNRENYQLSSYCRCSPSLSKIICLGTGTSGRQGISIAASVESSQFRAENYAAS